MKVKEAIEALSTMDSEAEILVLWWEEDEFSDVIDEAGYDVSEQNSEAWVKTVADLQSVDHIDEYVVSEIQNQLQENINY